MRRGPFRPGVSGLAGGAARPEGRGAKEFWLAFVRSCPGALHFRQLAGENTHHILEACFKGMARALRGAVAPEKGFEDEIPSTKGTLI